MDYNTQCAANIEFIGNSCYPIEVLEEMVDDLCNCEDFKHTIVNYYYKKDKKKDELINVMKLSNIEHLKEKNQIEYKKFIVDILSQVIQNIKMEKTNNSNEFKNMKKQYNWLLIPLFKNLRKKYDRNDFFRPKGPNVGHQWLSNFDIMDVMKQYEKKYIDYKFLGAVPRDFDNFDKWNFSNKDYNNYYEHNVKKNRFGIIFNLDLSNQSGSHWTALYFDMIKKQIYYQDSVGKPPKKEFIHLMQSIKKQMINNIKNSSKKSNTPSLTNYNAKPSGGYDYYYNLIDNDDNYNDNNINDDDDYNNLINNNYGIDIVISKTQHQKEGSECGVYATSFILRLLCGQDIRKIIKKIVRDNEINKCRLKYFNNFND